MPSWSVLENYDSLNYFIPEVENRNFGGTFLCQSTISFFFDEQCSPFSPIKPKLFLSPLTPPSFHTSFFISSCLSFISICVAAALVKGREASGRRGRRRNRTMRRRKKRRRRSGEAPPRREMNICLFFHPPKTQFSAFYIPVLK